MPEILFGVGGIFGGVSSAGVLTAASATTQALGGLAFMVGANFGLSYLTRALSAQPGLPSTLPLPPNMSVSGKSSVASRRIIYGRVGVSGVLTATFPQQVGPVYYTHEVWTLSGGNRPLTAIEKLFADAHEVVLGDDGGASGYALTARTVYTNILNVEEHLGDPADTSQPFPLLAGIANSGWLSQHNYVLNQWIIDPHGNAQYVTTAGKSGSSAPTWSTTGGGITTDGTAIWTCVEASPEGTWGATDLQRGCAKAHFRYWTTASFSTSDPYGQPMNTSSPFANSQPNWRWQLKGYAVYDPRDGAQDPADDSTWQWSDNPALILLDYLTDKFFGLKHTIAEIDLSSFIAAANACDETVSLKAGGTEKRYTCNLAFSMDRKATDVIADILSCMCGEAQIVGKTWICNAGVWRGSQGTITEQMIHGEIKTVVLGSKRDLHNGGKGTFISADRFWQPAEFPAQISTAYSTADGEPLWLDMQLGGTTSYTMAQRIVKIAMEESRRQMQIEVVCSLSAYRYVFGDTVGITRARYGWTAKTFKVLKSERFWDAVPGENGGDPVQVLRVRLTLKEHDANVYNWTPSTDELPLDITKPYILPTMDAAALIGSRITNVNNDGTYATKNYHSSAARRQISAAIGGSASEPGGNAGGSVTIVSPPSGVTLIGTLTGSIAKGANTVWDQTVTLTATWSGGSVSDSLTFSNPATSGSKAVSLDIPGGVSATLQVSVTVDSTPNGNSVGTGSFARNEYQDMAPENVN